MTGGGAHWNASFAEGFPAARFMPLKILFGGKEVSSTMSSMRENLEITVRSWWHTVATKEFVGLVYEICVER